MTTDNFVLTSNMEYKLLDNSAAKYHGKRIEITTNGCHCCAREEYVSADEAIDILNSEINHLVEFKNKIQEFKSRQVEVCECCGRLVPISEIINVWGDDETYKLICKACNVEAASMANLYDAIFK